MGKSKKKKARKKQNKKWAKIFRSSRYNTVEYHKTPKDILDKPVSSKKELLTYPHYEEERFMTFFYDFSSVELPVSH